MSTRKIYLKCNRFKLISLIRLHTDSSISKINAPISPNPKITLSKNISPTSHMPSTKALLFFNFWILDSPKTALIKSSGKTVSRKRSQWFQFSRKSTQFRNNISPKALNTPNSLVKQSSLSVVTKNEENKAHPNWWLLLNKPKEVKSL